MGRSPDELRALAEQLRLEAQNPGQRDRDTILRRADSWDQIAEVLEAVESVSARVASKLRKVIQRLERLR